MLAVDCGGIDRLRFPLIASPKLDGVRAIITADGVYSRTLKKIPNREVQAALEGLPVGLDGELLAGDPCAPDVYRKTVSMVMSEDADITGLKFHVFDIQKDAPFIERMEWIEANVIPCPPYVTIVDQWPANSVDEVAEYEAAWVSAGYEGVILRSPDSPYKHGRSTVKEGYLLKLKRFMDSEAVVIGVTELQHNGNAAKVNALGHTERSSHKAGKFASGLMGTLQVRDTKTGVTFEIGTGFTQDERHTIFLLPHEYLGRLAKYKYFPVGVKDKPRHPVFLGWRSKLDV